MAHIHQLQTQLDALHTYADGNNTLVGLIDSCINEIQTLNDEILVESLAQEELDAQDKKPGETAWKPDYMGSANHNTNTKGLLPHVASVPTQPAVRLDTVEFVRELLQQYKAVKTSTTTLTKLKDIMVDAWDWYDIDRTTQKPDHVMERIWKCVIWLSYMCKTVV